jgi:hypothetical protein
MVQLTPQERTQWCWVAVIQALLPRLGGDPMLTKCQIAFKVLSSLVQAPCCPQPPANQPYPCDRTVTNLATALKIVLEADRADGPLGCVNTPIDQIEKALERHPVPGLYRAGNTNHYCLITGLIYMSGNVLLEVQCPRVAEVIKVTDNLGRMASVCYRSEGIQKTLQHVYFLK